MFRLLCKHDVAMAFKDLDGLLQWGTNAVRRNVLNFCRVLMQGHGCALRSEYFDHPGAEPVGEALWVTVRPILR